MPKDSYEEQIAKGMNPAGGPDKSAAEVAKDQGTRVWNAWQDEVAEDLQDDAADAAIAEHGTEVQAKPKKKTAKKT